MGTGSGKTNTERRQTIIVSVYLFALHCLKETRIVIICVLFLLQSCCGLKLVRCSCSSPLLLRAMHWSEWVSYAARRSASAREAANSSSGSDDDQVVGGDSGATMATEPATARAPPSSSVGQGARSEEPQLATNLPPAEPELDLSLFTAPESRRGRPKLGLQIAAELTASNAVAAPLLSRKSLLTTLLRNPCLRTRRLHCLHCPHWPLPLEWFHMSPLTNRNI